MSAYVANTLRGGFGKALHDISCMQPSTKCRECLLGSRCAYGYLFETPIPPDATVMRNYTHAPHPFVFRPPVEHPSMVSEGTTMDLSLLLIGKGVSYFPFFVIGLLKLGELGLGADRVPFVIEEIRACNGDVLYAESAKGPVASPEPEAFTATVGCPREARFSIHYRTPTRLMTDGRILRRPAFGPLVSAALRRLQLLCAVHDEGEFNLDTAELARAAHDVRLTRDMTRWADKSRYSHRQDQCVPIGGLVGTAELSGDIGTFLPLLDLAAKVHIGKGTAFGHGRFQVEEEDADV